MKLVRWVAGLNGWLYQPAFILLLIFSGILGLLASREFDEGSYGRGDYGLFLLAILVPAILYAAQVLRDRGQVGLILDVRSKARTDLGDAIDIAAEEIGQLVKARGAVQRSEIYGRALTLLLAAACETAGPGHGRLRASFFEHRQATATEPEGLYHVASSGREASSFNFQAGTDIGDEALRMVKAREHLYEPDVDKAPPLHWTKGKPAEYKAFLSVSCAIKKAPIGMLTIDSTDQEDISEEDLPAMRMIGRLICVACRLQKR